MDTGGASNSNENNTGVSPQTIAANLSHLIPLINSFPYPIYTLKEIDDYVIRGIHNTAKYNAFNFYRFYENKIGELALSIMLPVFLNGQQFNYVRERFINNTVNDDMDINNDEYSYYINFFD